MRSEYSRAKIMLPPSSRKTSAYDFCICGLVPVVSCDKYDHIGQISPYMSFLKLVILGSRSLSRAFSQPFEAVLSRENACFSRSGDFDQAAVLA